ncbi:cytochrome c biogenesis protein CcsA [Pontibacter sp. BT310]|uniref:Cytochrome c biogenesis protein CcsA n=1 Tax=Pontibacter populi TaxID=890055 RepID=A0ABS6X886_9BACT|nr:MULTISPECIES: cytochrome c biogenesis protein CcsA [Pontibacter]MBJ6117348.1 cytochrome c biogenesis protein CcsA [Pontibacter sp. BT310]MBR0569773.1 cytochrome c biogenesis protein CcsA [Microvirga sp. STS03]MBW3364201.1 cytochrome c biogenesis protein CcsA [Pontibacter populi]
MINTLIGDIGHLSVIIAFVAAIVASYAYFMASRSSIDAEAIAKWRRFARGAFYVHSAAVLLVIFALFNIIYEHRYEYYYAWSHSSNHLPVHFMISCFWEGQEGSFLLWIFWHVVLGIVLLNTGKKYKEWEAPVMAMFSFVQLFLTSMILGVVIGDLKIGSSPFILMRDFMPDTPVFAMDPNYIPEDGTGLNPLLQNYWMVIHPPTLFLGFAATLVPFAFAMAGLWKNKFGEWVRPALPWAHFAAVSLGIGTVMGAYWAYETLNFGGYWNWDPVENAVYIPWLVLVGAIHTMVAYRRGKQGLKASYLLIIASFILILYATFLTRSGILGNASVHSFTDLGLSGQLFTYLAVFAVLAVALLIYKWKHIPTTEKELTTYSGEFWVFIGAAVLCLAGFQVLATTSIPVYNSFLGFIGIESNAALPADQIEHYTKFQLWAGVLIAVLTGIGQLMWWRKTDKKSFGDAITMPLMLTLLFASLVIILSNKFDVFDFKLDNPVYITLFVTSLFAVFANLSIILSLLHKKVTLSGGAVSHIGIALMLLGVLFSSGYSNIISGNTSGMLYSREFPDEINRDNVLLWRNTTTDMDKYSVSYRGQFLEVEGVPEYVNKEILFRTADEYTAIARADIKVNDKLYFKTGDTLELPTPENTYYQVEYKNRETEETFTLYPRAQVNPNMGLLASPDIKASVTKDLYTHVSSVPDPNEEKEWSELQEYTVTMGDTIILNDYVAIFNGVEVIKEVPGVPLKEGDIAVQADMKIMGEKKTYHAHPLLIFKDGMAGYYPEIIEDLGLRITFLNVDPTKEEFKIGVNTTQKDYIILKAMEKPFVSILWIGTIVMSIGFVMAIVRRNQEGGSKEPKAKPAKKAEKAQVA